MRHPLLACILALVAAASHAGNATQEAVERLHDDAAARIAAGRFDSLLADVDQALTSKERIADGRWKLALLIGGMRMGFERAATSPEDWTAFDKTLRAQATAHPDSPNAWLLVAVLADSHAWAVRGKGMADGITTMGFDAFRRYNEQARTVLEAHPMPGNPAWYALRIKVGGALHESPAQLDALFDEAFQREPAYQQTWYSRLTFLEPQWGGSVDAVVRLAKQGAVDTSPAEGRGMMARVLFLAYDSGVATALTDPGVDWDTLKASMEDVLRHYHDDWNAQPFFFEACSRGDKAEAQHLLGFVKEAPIDEVLNGGVDMFRTCVDWVNGKVPGFRLHDENGNVRLIH